MVAGAPAAVLHIGAQGSVVVAGTGAEPAATLALAVGAQKTAQDFFRRNPPTPLELENAIATVEDEVVRALAVLPAGCTLWCGDTLVREVAVRAGVQPGPRMALSLEAMERVFERFAAVAEGRPAALEGLPGNPEFAATLLILREFMHHLRFASITVLADTAA
ncbi:hypothetical protein B2J86_07735 [Acidovorax sp. SRB_14]|nr:hypothetical protein [Acidovorax sp. SRB_24]NMM80823.1 hypothetical protein [Acidovorax sp. SRB_14]NMM85796.1 hypothetical protein [Rhodococcus sp. SRB_17]